MTWKVTNSQDYAPKYVRYLINTEAVTPGTVDYNFGIAGGTVDIDWGDGTSNTAVSTNTTHTYSSPGYYVVTISQGTSFFKPDIGLQEISVEHESVEGGGFWSNTMGYAAQDASNLKRWGSVDLGNVTSFVESWANCSSLTSFPVIDTSSGETFFRAWLLCSSLTNFPLIDTSSGTNFGQAWQNCSSLTSFPLIDTSSGTNLGQAWQNCSSLKSFPLINTAAATTLLNAWGDCSNLDNVANAGQATSFPLIDTSNVTDFGAAWRACSSLTSFPLLDTSSGTNFFSSWRQCSSLASFPAIDTSLGTNFSLAWDGNAFSTFPALNFSSATSMGYTWNGCSNLTEFPALSAAQRFSSAMVNGSAPYGGFRGTWGNCTSLTTFPPNIFDDVINCTEFVYAFQNCALTAQSIENILVSIDTANTSNGTLSLNGGTNAGQSTWTAAATTAYNNLIARGWTISANP